jgi:polysaccharide pyruvyl transferase WcaK-like protein
MRVLLTGAYRWANRGDAALVLSALDWLKGLGADVVGITSFDPDGDSARYPVPVMGMPIAPPGRIGLLLERIARVVPLARAALAALRLVSMWGFCAYLSRWARIRSRNPELAARLANRRTRALADAVLSADLVLGVPGGYLLAPRLIDDWWLLHVPALVLAKSLGRPVALAPCSVGPFVGPHSRAAAGLLPKLDCIVVRERYSAKFALELGVQPDRIIAAPDMAFIFLPRPEEAPGTDASRPSGEPSGGNLVGVSVRNHSFPGAADPAALMSAYLDAVADALTRLGRQGAKVVVVHQTEEDLGTTSLLIRRLEQTSVEFTVVGEGISPSQLAQLYGSLDLLIGTRMHANILALTQSTPVVGIGYEPKTTGILEDLDLAEWGISIEDVAAGRLWPLVEKAWASRRVNREVVATRVARARARFTDLWAAISERCLLSPVETNQRVGRDAS